MINPSGPKSRNRLNPHIDHHLFDIAIGELCGNQRPLGEFHQRQNVGACCS
jgi:hypothetical protein